MYPAEVIKESIILYSQLRNFRSVAKATGIGKSTIHRWYMNFGRLLKRHPVQKRKAKKRTYPTLQDDIQRILENKTNIILSLLDIVKLLNYTPSITSVWRSLKTLKVCRTKIVFKVGRTNTASHQAKRDLFEPAIASIPLDEILCLDETGFCNEGNMLHYYHLKSSNEPGRKRIQVHMRQKLSSMAVISNNSLLIVKHQEGAYRSPLFMDFIVNDLCHVIKSNHKYLLMDNASFHHNRFIDGAIRSIGLTPLYIPAYSPQYNPIEECFSYVKHHFRRSMSLCKGFKKSVDAAFEHLVNYKKFSTHYQRSFRNHQTT